MAGRQINHWLMLGIGLGAIAFLLGTWLVAWINNWAVSTVWSLLVLAVILQPLYQRWSRRRQRAI
jgi:Zn-dependent protease with chaperone function